MKRILLVVALLVFGGLKGSIIGSLLSEDRVDSPIEITVMGKRIDLRKERCDSLNLLELWAFTKSPEDTRKLILKMESCIREFEKLKSCVSESLKAREKEEAEKTGAQS